MIKDDFKSNEEYPEWLNAHPGGFVLNAWRTQPAHPKLKDHTLHRASCGSVHRSDSITPTIMKAWSDNLRELIVRYQPWIGDEANFCGPCNPQS